MIKGQLYKATFASYHTDPSRFWTDAGPILYLGEDVIERSDGVSIVNHAVLVRGQRRIIDRTFLRYLEPLTNA